MSEYYAVQRSGDSLAHYGVKGMRWGVQKAKASGNERKLVKQYAKASKKLAKLQNNANVDYQKKRIKNASNKQKLDLTLGGINAGIAAGLTGSSYSRAAKMAKRGFNSKYNVYIPVGAGVAAADAAVRQVGKSKARKLASAEGHKQAVKEANNFRNEMSKAFKGTKFSKNIGGMAKDIAAKKRSRVERNVARYESNGKLNRIVNMYSSNGNQKKSKKRR